MNCKSEAAEPGKTLCFKCAEKDRERARKRREGMSEEQKKAQYSKNAEYNRRTYAERKAAGICTKCGKRKVAPGSVLCIDCRTKKRRKKDPRWNNDIPRSERKEHGLCYICGAPVCQESKSLCRKHYELYSNRMKHLNANPTEKMIKAREEYAKEFRGFKKLLWKGVGNNGQKN